MFRQWCLIQVSFSQSISQSVRLVQLIEQPPPSHLGSHDPPTSCVGVVLLEGFQVLLVSFQFETKTLRERKYVHMWYCPCSLFFFFVVFICLF